MELLEIRNLNVVYTIKSRETIAIRDLSFTVKKGDSVAIIGESGSGKTTLALSLMRLLPDNAKVKSGEILLEGKDILSLKKEELRKIRWRKISMIPQASQNALDPLKKIGDQLIELYLYHNRGASKEEAIDRIISNLKEVNLGEHVMAMYPHELSGGMKQRVIIASSLLFNPEILIADEPTTALDVITQAEILSLIRKIVRERGITLLFISHDISLSKTLCNRMIVMYRGTDVEQGDLNDILLSPIHPYTEMLIETLKSLEEGKLPNKRLNSDFDNLIGCPFLPMCDIAISKCSQFFPLKYKLGHRIVRCFVRGEQHE